MSSSFPVTRPHCPSCTCAPTVPSTFVSDVVHLPVDLDRVARFQVGRGRDARVDEFKALTVVFWRPEYSVDLPRRIAFYRLLVDDGTCGNIREAVKMAAINRRAAEAEETARYVARLRQNIRLYYRDGYLRGLGRKKDLVLAEDGPCRYCGDPNPRTVDHIIPTARGGDHRRRNLTPACHSCNCEKNNRTPAEWKADRLAAGLAWPPHPSVERPNIPQGLGAKISAAQRAELQKALEGGARGAFLEPFQYRTLLALERHDLITPTFGGRHTVTDRGRVALKTGRIPR